MNANVISIKTINHRKNPKRNIKRLYDYQPGKFAMPAEQKKLAKRKWEWCFWEWAYLLKNIMALTETEKGIVDDA